MYGLKSTSCPTHAQTLAINKIALVNDYKVT